jgi:hypothetical protein
MYVIISQTKVGHWTSCCNYRIYVHKHMLMISYRNIETAIICMSSFMHIPKHFSCTLVQHLNVCNTSPLVSD